MKDFETIMTFTLPSDLMIARTKLESQDIECRVLNEHIVQSHNFLSNAVGGVKLQVPVADFERARAILKEGGFLTEELEEESSFLHRKLSDPVFYRWTKRSLIAIAVVIGLMFMALLINYISQRPSDYARLTNMTWCLDHVVYQDQMIKPYSLDIVVPRGIGDCYEYLTFDTLGTVRFPGFDSDPFDRHWTLENGQIVITKPDSVETVFDGIYDYELSGFKLTMTSDSLQIVCLREYL